MLQSQWLLAALLGLDSLAVGFGLGAALPRKQRLWLALTFGACDGLASLLGWAVGVAGWRASLEWCEWLRPAAVAGYGAFVLLLAWRGRRLLDGDRLALLVPMCLSLDNLVAGAGAEASFVPAALAALAFAVVSGGLAYLGLWLGGVAAERARQRAGWLAGSALVAVAAALALKDVLS